MASVRLFTKRIYATLIKVFLGTADASIWESFKQELQDKQIHYEVIYSDDHIVNFVLLFLRAEQSEVQELIRQFSIVAFTYNRAQLPKIELTTIQREIMELVEEQKKLARLIGQKKSLLNIWKHQRRYCWRRKIVG